MHAKNFSFHDSSKWQIVKCVIEIVPYIMIAIFLCDFIIETINIGDIARLMISSEKYDHLGVFYFVEEEEKNGLD
jgi:hypothetical protein